MSTTPNPLIPQGSLQSKAARGASNVRIAVATIIAIHVVFFGGLLLQGCKRDNKTALAESTNAPLLTNTALSLPPMDTNSSSLYYPSSNSLPPENTNFATDAGPTNAGELSGVQPRTNQDLWSNPAGNNSLGTALVSPESGATREYTIVRGDSFYKIAKENGTTIAAIQAANPNVAPTKIQPGMKIQVPVKSASASNNALGASGPASSGNGGTVYTVKSGDTLTRIAHQHGVSLSSIRKANGMRTSRVNVGQKLKIPSPKAASPSPAPESAANAPTY
jgi:LysM repeat protein